MSHSSRIPEFRRWSLAARRRELAERAGLDRDDLALLDTGGIAAADANRMVENAVGIYALPLGVALNFQVNQRDYLVPMAVEEPSVIAAASYAARMVRAGGGFFAAADAPVMIAQVELREVGDPTSARARIEAARAEILALADGCQAVLVSVGGGARDLEVRHVTGSTQNRLVVHLHVNCRDAMGANSVNTMAETVAPRLAELSGGRVGLRILSNLADRRLVRVSARVPFAALASDKGAAGAGRQVAEGIAAASRFAEDDPYRTATHNKGIMNGVDAVVMATGNDWRGVEAGAHAYAARDGRYRPLSTWKVEGDALVGRLEMPMAVGTVGGTLQVHAGARLALRILRVSSSEELAMVIGAAGLGQNLAALRALATEGIQRGHMSLHKRAVGDPSPDPKGARS